MNKKYMRGFTLIELMIVIAIITILTTMALPSYHDRVIRKQVTEGFNLAEVAQNAVQEFYKAKKRLPSSNKEAGLPSPDLIVGNYVSSVEVKKGVIEVTLGNRINAHVEGKTVTIRPAIVKKAPVVPIAWVYAYASVPDKMTVIGENTTTVLPRHLPVNCRY